jgi:hypothetical protein
MSFAIVLCILSVLLFLIFGDKKKLPVFTHTSLVASLIATMTDLLMIPYPLWNYPSQTSWNLFYKQMIHTFTVYPVVVYLFLQTLPRKQTFITVARHIFYWTIPCILLEWISLKIKYIEHGLWWNLGYSYLADWILFSLFYIYHKWVMKHMNEVYE